MKNPAKETAKIDVKKAEKVKKQKLL